MDKDLKSQAKLFPFCFAQFLVVPIKLGEGPESHKRLL
jgi:hypothetical protein